MTYKGQSKVTMRITNTDTKFFKLDSRLKSEYLSWLNDKGYLDAYIDEFIDEKIKKLKELKESV